MPGRTHALKTFSKLTLQRFHQTQSFLQLLRKPKTSAYLDHKVIFMVLEIKKESLRHLFIKNGRLGVSRKQCDQISYLELQQLVTLQR